MKTIILSLCMFSLLIVCAARNPEAEPVPQIAPRIERFLNLQGKIENAINRNQHLIDVLDNTPEQTIVIAEGDTVRRVISVTAAEKVRIRSAIKANCDSVVIWANRARALIP